uniref:Transmembrane protein n=1 Tax=Heterorhabditis bacteriophora TaxID=37862 RepID=A0A1I7X5Q3_HETBA
MGVLTRPDTPDKPMVKANFFIFKEQMGIHSVAISNDIFFSSFLHISLLFNMILPLVYICFLLKYIILNDTSRRFRRPVSCHSSTIQQERKSAHWRISPSLGSGVLKRSSQGESFLLPVKYKSKFHCFTIKFIILNCLYALGISIIYFVKKIFIMTV